MTHVALRIVGSAGVIIIGAFAIFLAWVELTVPKNPDAILQIWPDNAAALTVKAETLRQTGTNNFTALNEIGDRLLTAYPIGHAPLIYAADALAKEDDIARAHSLYQMALRRQPRNTPALTSKAAIAIKEGRFDDAIQTLEILARLNPDNAPVYVDTLMAIATADQGVFPFEKALQAESPMAITALRALNRTETNPSLLLRYNAIYPEFSTPLIRKLFDEQGPEMAFIAWLSLLPSSEAKSFSWPYDPTFIGNSAPPPFAWSITKNAELQSQGGLYASHSGRGKNDIRFANQTMLLAPGLYKLQTDIDGKVTRDSAYFEWTVTCVASGETIGKLPIKTLDRTVQRHEAYVDVPRNNCTAQNLVFSGVAGLYPIRSRGIVRSVSIEPVTE